MIAGNNRRMRLYIATTKRPGKSSKATWRHVEDEKKKETKKKRRWTAAASNMIEKLLAWDKLNINWIFFLCSFLHVKVCGNKQRRRNYFEKFKKLPSPDADCHICFTSFSLLFCRCCWTNRNRNEKFRVENWILLLTKKLTSLNIEYEFKVIGLLSFYTVVRFLMQLNSKCMVNAFLLDTVIIGIYRKFNALNLGKPQPRNTE